MSFGSMLLAGKGLSRGHQHTLVTAQYEARTYRVGIKWHRQSLSVVVDV